MARNNVKILFFPDKILNIPCVDVAFPLKNEDIECIYEMKNSVTNITGFYYKKGLGISANQVGFNKRIMVLSMFPRNSLLLHKFFKVIINPKILELSNEKSIKWEGCLSENKFMALIERNKHVKISYFNQVGLTITEDLNELFTRLFLHEYDHLEGKSFSDKALKKVEISKLENENYLDKWNKEQMSKNLLI